MSIDIYEKEEQLAILSSIETNLKNMLLNEAIKRELTILTRVIGDELTLNQNNNTINKRGNNSD